VREPQEVEQAQVGGEIFVDGGLDQGERVEKVGRRSGQL
jgi:hypothetical protein